MIKLIYIIVIFNIYLAGIVYKVGNLSIKESISNKNEYSDYTFKFKLENDLPIGGFLQVVFPNQYQEALGISFSAKCNVKCINGNYDIKFYFDNILLKGVEHSVKVFDILNPTKRGGTGNFKLSTIFGNNILDENYNFGNIGISETALQFSSANIKFVNGYSDMVKEETRIEIDFKVNTDINENTYIRIKFPDNGFVLIEERICILKILNNFNTIKSLNCKQDDKDYITNKINLKIKKNTNIKFEFQVFNPPVSLTTGNFKLIIMRENTNYIINWKKDINGLIIKPNLLNITKFAPFHDFSKLSRNKLILINIIFKIKILISNKGSIKLNIPKNFWYNHQENYSFKINSGLSNTSKVIYDSNTREITINNFDQVEIDTIINISIFLKLPFLTGNSNSLNIYTYDENNLLLENNLNNVLSLNEVQVPIFYNVYLNNYVANNTGTFDLFIDFDSYYNYLNNSKIIIYFDKSVSLLTTGTCSIFYNNSLTETNTNCTINSKSIEITTNTAINLQTRNKVKLTNIVGRPMFSETWNIEVNIMNVTTLKESFLITLKLLPNNLTSINSEVIPKNINNKSILFIKFQSPYNIISSKETDIDFSYIIISFISLGTTIIPSDLNYNKSFGSIIPCKEISNIIPYDSNLICKLYFTGKYSSIKITNYSQINLNTLAEVAFPNFSNPNGNFKIQIDIYFSNNKILNIINTGNFDIILDNTIPSAMNAIPNNNALEFYFITSQNVSSNFNIKFETFFTSNININQYIIIKLPYYDIGFIDKATPPQCLINEKNYNCDFYDNIDWLLIKIDSAANQITTGGTIKNYIKINNLRWPRYSIENEKILIDVVGTNFLIQNRYQYINLPKAIPNELKYNKIEISNLDKNNSDVKYTFLWKSTNILPNGSVLEIYFPIKYNLFGSNPPIKVISKDLIGYNNNPLNILVSSNKIRLENINLYGSNKLFSIEIHGVKNPNSYDVFDTWVIQILLNNYILERSESLNSFSLNKLFMSRYLKIDKIEVFPRNELLYGNFSFSINPKEKLSIGSEIRVYFPGQFTNFPSKPICKIAGSLTTFKNCFINSNIISMVLDKEYTTGTIILTFEQIKNPKYGFTDSFEIEILYDGIKKEISNPIDKLNRRIYFQKAPLDISIINFEINPKNEAEKSIYTIDFLPKNFISFDSEILIIFPKYFDALIGENISIKITNGLKGNLSFKIETRVIKIFGFNNYYPSENNFIKISIINIINPNKIFGENNGKIQLAIKKRLSDYFLEYKNEAGIVESLEAPGWLKLENLSSKNYFSRFNSDYTFIFLTNEFIPSKSEKGTIIFSFPKNYNLNNKQYLCSNFENKIKNLENCQRNNTDIIVEGGESKIKGKLTFILRKIENPEIKGETDYFSVKILDGFSRRIIERSFDNWDPYFFNFVYSGPLITINNNKPIVVEAGTQTEDLYIIFEKPSRLNLILKPSTISGISFIPFDIKVNIGDLRINFRVSINENLSSGEYWINWTILNETNPPFYTPLPKTLIKVTKILNQPIIIDNINSIPFRGTSLGTRFFLRNSPESDLQIITRFKYNYKGISLSNQNNFLFSAGQNEKFLEVYFSNSTAAETENLSTGEIELFIQGTNKKIYKLPFLNLKFNIIPELNSVPRIIQIRTLNLGLIDITLEVTANEISNIYYVLVLEGSIKPTFREAKNQGPSLHITTQSKYGLTILKNDLKTNINFNNLETGVRYDLYLYLEDRGLNKSIEPFKYNFKTLSRYRSAITIFNLKKSFLNQSEKYLLRKEISFITSLPINLVIENKYDIGISKELKSQGNYFSLIISSNSLTNNYERPIIHSKIINTEKQFIARKLNFLDATKDFAIFEFPKINVNFYLVF